MARRAKPPAGIEEALRAAMLESGLSEYEIGKRAGVAASVLNRFRRGERTLTLPVADRVARALGLGLVVVAAPLEREA